MGAAPSTPRGDAEPEEKAEYLFRTFVGAKSQDLRSQFWHKLLSLPLAAYWPESRVHEACQSLAQNNRYTRHLAKLLIHLIWSLQETASTSGARSVHSKAMNAARLSSVFLKYLIENSKCDNFAEPLYLSLTDTDVKNDGLPEVHHVTEFVIQGLLCFIGSSDVTPSSYLLHLEVINLLLVAMSTQLHSQATLGPKDIHPFIDAAMVQENILVGPFVRKLLISYMARLPLPSNAAYNINVSRGNQSGVLRKVGSAAATVVLIPYYTYNYLVNSSGEISRRPLADNSLLLLLVLIHYRKSLPLEEATVHKLEVNGSGGLGDNMGFHHNPYSKALETARDIEFDRVDVEGSAQNGPVVRLPFASLFDTLGCCLTDESSILLLYSLLHGNSDFLEYVLVRTDLDTLLMPVLEMLYDAPRRSSNQIYMLLIILLILSQDSSFNASIHKLILPNVPWYREQLLPRTSLGSLMVVILIRTVKYNLSKHRDIYIHTNCLAILANMAPHVHRLSAYASQRLVSLFDMLSRKYTKLAEANNNMIHTMKVNPLEGKDLDDDTPTQLHIYTDFLRIVLEIINAILTYALPRNPEVVYAILHRQELFKPFKDHPSFYELVDNIYTVLDFFNSRMDSQRIDGEWSVEKVLQIIVANCRSWRGEGMKMFTQLRFTYEQEHQPEEFFIPYVWKLVVSQSGLDFDLDTVCLYPAKPPSEDVPADKTIDVQLSPAIEV
uniref:Dymeclin n=1 Tax=Araucaria cunninghamii TaxID=56994 RepID=A0A0D6R327_ARACU